MKTPAILLFAVVMTIVLHSCVCHGSNTGSDYQFSITLQGFSDSDVTPLTLKSYVKGSNFTTLLDSTVYPNLANGTTTHFILVQDNDSTDYQVKIKVLQNGVDTAAYYNISNITYRLVKGYDCTKGQQFHTLSGYNLNGESLSASGDVLIQQ